MLISEIYISRQGEGGLALTPSVFVRTSGCNLRCDFCDTPFTSWNPEGTQQPVAGIVDRVKAVALKPLPQRAGETMDPNKAAAQHVVLTGGEPMLAKEVESLCELLSESGFHITIETAGTIDRELKCDLISISPKLSNSTPAEQRAGNWTARHEATRHRPDIVAALIERHDYQLKFVVASPEDVAEIESYLLEVGTVDRKKVMLMPEGVDSETLEQRGSWLESLCDEKGFTFCQRLHIFWYGNKRAT